MHASDILLVFCFILNLANDSKGMKTFTNMRKLFSQREVFCNVNIFIFQRQKYINFGIIFATEFNYNVNVDQAS